MKRDKEIPNFKDLSEEEKKALVESLMYTSEKTRPDIEEEITPLQKMLAFIGVPSESNPHNLSSPPFTTYFLILITTLISLYIFYVNPSWGEVLAFVPGDPFKFYGLNFLTCFLVHGDLFHLLSNMYCLFVFGDNVEDEIGKRKYILLIVLATFFGSLLTGFFNRTEMIPHVGASGGIFGVMIFYLLNFPKARFTYFFFFQFYRVPASVVLMIYCLSQFFGVIQQMSGVGHVDYMAHIGGGITGFLMWVYEKNYSS